MLVPPSDLSAGEAYVFDDIDLEGDIFDVMEFGADLDGLSIGPKALALLALARSLPAPERHDEVERTRPRTPGRLHSILRDREAVSYHYDTGNDFFRLFLDEAMVYSCADFLGPDESLDVAQRRKLDLICRKLHLSKGDRLLDVGCGWGGLVIHAARNYGVEAVGITLSREQAEEATRRARDAGVADRVDIRVRDYREVEGTFDAVASVGMVEHVGRENLSLYFQRLRELARPGGIVLNHGIVDNGPGAGSRTPSFVRTYVFPDGDLRPLGETVTAAEDAGFEVRDVEGLRASYALTLRHWVARLEAHREEAIRATSQETYRIFRAYMAGSAIAFERGAIGVHQLLLVDRDRPWDFGRSTLLAADDRSAAPMEDRQAG